MSGEGYHFPSATRAGFITEYALGTCKVYLVVNPDENGVPREMFGKADEGYTPHVEDACIPISVALKHGAPVAMLAALFRYRRGYPPEGGPGQAKAIGDAIGRELEKWAQTGARPPCAEPVG